MDNSLEKKQECTVKPITDSEHSKKGGPQQMAESLEHKKDDSNKQPGNSSMLEKDKTQITDVSLPKKAFGIKDKADHFKQSSDGGVLSNTVSEECQRLSQVKSISVTHSYNDELSCNSQLGSLRNPGLSSHTGESLRSTGSRRSVGIQPTVLGYTGKTYPATVLGYPTGKNYPAGIGTLLNTTQVTVHMDERTLRWYEVIRPEAVNRMEIIDDTRHLLFRVEEDPPLADVASVTFRFYNTDYEEVVTLSSPDCETCFMCGFSCHFCGEHRFQALVYSPPGLLIGSVRKARSCCLQEFELLNTQEDVVLRLVGTSTDLQLRNLDLGFILGRVAVHGWGGTMHEIRRSNEDYGITFPLDLDLRVKLLILASVFAIDWYYTTKGGRYRFA